MTDTSESKRRSFGTPTIYDIAKLADVSPSTVSRALNQPGRINSITEERIRKAAKELNYRVNPMARSLPTGRTKMLAVIVADITNPMFFDVVRGAEIAASAQGYTAVIAESQESGTREASAMEKIIPTVDGVVLATTRLSDAEIQELSDSKAVVLMNRKVDGVVDVVPQMKQGIEEAVDHLASLGHTQIAYLAGPSNAWMSKHRSDLIFDYAVNSGLKIVEIGPNSPTFGAGRDSYRKIMASGCTAVIAYNDLLAIGLMKQAQDEGVSIPNQLSIIGFDDIFGTELTSPSLTTVKSPLAEAGKVAVETLLEVLDDKQIQANYAELKTKLLLRESTAAPQEGN